MSQIKKNMKKDERKPKRLKNKAAQSQKPILSAKQSAKLMLDNYVWQRNRKSAEQTQEHTDETMYAIDNIEETAYMAADEIMLPRAPKIKSVKEPKIATKQKTFNYNDDLSVGDSCKSEQPKRLIPKQQPKTVKQQQPILKQQLKPVEQQELVPKQQSKSVQPKQQLSKQRQLLKEKPAYSSQTPAENPKTDIKSEQQEPKSKPTATLIKERQIKFNPLPEEIPRQGVVCDVSAKPAIKEKTVCISPKNRQQYKQQNIQPNAAQFELRFESAKPDIPMVKQNPIAHQEKPANNQEYFIQESPRNKAQFEPHFKSAKSDIPIVKRKPSVYLEKPVNNQANFIQKSHRNKAQFEPYLEPTKTDDDMPAKSYVKPLPQVSSKSKPINIALKTKRVVYDKKSANPKQQTSGREKAAAKLAGRAKVQMQWLAIQKTQKFAGVSAKFGKSLIQLAAKTITAVAKPLSAMLGGSIALIILAAVVLIAAIVSSPFGLFFAGERSAANAVSLAEAVASVNVAYNARLAELQDDDYAGIEITGQTAAWSDVLAVFAVKVAGADVGGLDVVTLDSHRLELLKSVFWDMTSISTETESSDSGEILKITISAKSADDMRTAYAFSEYQNSALDELLAESAALISLAGSLDITNVDALEVLAALPDDLPEQRRNVVQTALTLYGKVNYFWGGKSLAIGWDSRWGELRKVTAAGSRTTGSYRPFGLDCSGFVDWVFYNVTDGGYIIGHGGGAASQHNYCTDISWDEAMPGDLVFYLEDDHVGIVCGRDESGNLLVIHCASSANNVVITGTSGFSFVARPDYYSD